MLRDGNRTQDLSLASTIALPTELREVDEDFGAHSVVLVQFLI